ncbi:hypothetical protein MAPG_02001 [Magnaporthiopsis poae ATCC 64411]|uniref:Uncharacterized protein n=1 Tax=Magnaporthiopsis poae (strain ATCC 64411 / 73-15) TaxID=644358 RepID=A0A0C4DQ63_MAGP6|nr:hypothetical protein MAPG_02001 [Magnaporthiopsis poae ATCC 64411]
MLAVNRTLRTAGRTLRLSQQQQRNYLRSSAPLTLAATSQSTSSSSPALRSTTRARPSSSTLSAFSTSATRQSLAPANMSSLEYDPEISDIASYVHNTAIDSDLAFDTARWVFLDTLGCGLEGLRFKDSTPSTAPSTSAL